MAQNALERLQTDAGMETMSGLTWDKQLKRLKERFGTGDLDGIVDVLATLVDADARRPLNHSQRMLRDKAEEASSPRSRPRFALRRPGWSACRRSSIARSPTCPTRSRTRHRRAMNAFADPDTDLAPADVARRHAAGEIELVDMREQYEWDAGRVPGSHHVEIERVASNAPP